MHHANFQIKFNYNIITSNTRRYPIKYPINPKVAPYLTTKTMAHVTAPAAWLVQGEQAILRADGPDTLRFKGLPSLEASNETRALDALPQMASCNAKLASVALRASAITIEGQAQMMMQSTAEDLGAQLVTAFAPVQALSYHIDDLGYTTKKMEGKTPTDDAFELRNIEPTIVLTPENEDTYIHKSIIVAAALMFRLYNTNKGKHVTFTLAATREQRKMRSAFSYRKAKTTIDTHIKAVVEAIAAAKAHAATWMHNKIAAALTANGYPDAAFVVDWNPYVTDVLAVLNPPSVTPLDARTRDIINGTLWLNISYVINGRPQQFEIGSTKAMDIQVSHKRREATHAAHTYPDAGGKYVHVKVQGLPRGAASIQNDDDVMQIVNYAAYSRANYMDMLVAHKSPEVAAAMMTAAAQKIKADANECEYTPVHAIGVYGVTAWQEHGQTTGDGGASISNELAQKLGNGDHHITFDGMRFTITFTRSGKRNGGGGSGAAANPSTGPPKGQKRPTIHAQKPQQAKRTTATAAPAAQVVRGPSTHGPKEEKYGKAMEHLLSIRPKLFNATYRLDQAQDINKKMINNTVWEDNTMESSASAMINTYTTAKMSLMEIDAALHLPLLQHEPTETISGIAAYLMALSTSIDNSSIAATDGLLITQTIARTFFFGPTNPDENDVSMKLLNALHACRPEYDLDTTTEDNLSDCLEDLYNERHDPDDIEGDPHTAEHARAYQKHAKRAAITALWAFIQQEPNDPLRKVAKWWRHLLHPKVDGQEEHRDLPKHNEVLGALVNDRTEAVTFLFNKVDALCETILQLMQTYTFPTEFNGEESRQEASKPDSEQSVTFWNSDFGGALRQELVNKPSEYALLLPTFRPLFETLTWDDAGMTSARMAPNERWEQHIVARLPNLSDPSVENCWNNKYRHSMLLILVYISVYLENSNSHTLHPVSAYTYLQNDDMET
jgi:hypothetical protein